MATAGAANIATLGQQPQKTATLIDGTAMVPLAVVVTAVVGLVAAVWKLSSDRKETSMRLTAIELRLDKIDDINEQTHKMYVENKNMRKTMVVWMKQSGFNPPTADDMPNPDD